MKSYTKYLKRRLTLNRRAEKLGRKDFPGLSAAEVATAYTKVEDTYLKQKYLGARALREIDLLDYRINFIDYTTFRVLFDEVFVNQDYYFRTDQDAPYILDCGSNIGMAMLYFKKLYPNAVIKAFEPFSTAFATLQKNVADNRLQDVELFQMGLAEQCGTQTFYYDPEDMGSLRMSLREERIQGATDEIQTTTLSAHIDRPVDFLKMDIEGAEFGVLRELHETGKLALIKAMTIEYHHHINESEDRLSQVLQWLEQSGFGYQIHAGLAMPYEQGQFQDIILHCYRA